MLSRVAILTAICGLVLGAPIEEPKTNLPIVPDGFNASTRIIIDAPVDQVWKAITDLPSYPSWNPFIRSSIVVDDEGKPLPREAQVLRENNTMYLSIELPAIEGPVNERTPDSWLQQMATVNITDVLPTRGRFAYDVIDMPKSVLSSKRWTAVMDVGNGKTLYESREVFYGHASFLVRLLGGPMKDGFEAQGKALKKYVEERNKSNMKQV